MKLKYVTDKKNLICVPYTVENLHIMANNLCIDPSLFRKNHYSIKEYSEEIIKDIASKCKVVNIDNIIEIIRSPEYAELIISDNTAGGGANCNSHSFEATQILINGNNLDYG